MMRLFLRSFLCVLALVWAGFAVAQDGPDYENWGSLADRAERAIDAGRASDAALEAVRSELVGFRQQFQSARDSNGDRIATLRSQIEALGPVPENSEEPAPIAERRAQLEQQLQELRAPVLAAEEAFNRANGLIGEIDRIIATRRADAVLRLGPSPINPANWPETLTELSKAAASIQTETSNALANPAARAEFRSNLPLVVLFTLLGLVLIARGNRWAEWAGDWLRGWGGRGTGVWGFLVSLGRVALPLLGIVLLVEALFASGMVGVRSGLILENLPAWGATLLLLRWLCERLFSKRDADALLPFAPERRAELRLYGTFLAAVFVLRGALEAGFRIDNASETAQAVLAFPILLFAAVILFRLGQILARGPAILNEQDDAENLPSQGYLRLLRLLGQASVVIALITPALGAVGYMKLAETVLYPAFMTLALFGLVTVLQRFFTDVYGLLTRRGAEARDTLVSVMIGLMLTVASLPALALIWGMRRAELLEFWTRINEGVSLGETRISPMDFITFIVIFGAGYTVTRLFQGTLKTSLLPKTQLDMGGQNAIVAGTGYVGIFLAALIAITSAGIDLSSLAIVAGALSVGIGFGLQNIVSNFVSGIILLIERPIAEGDWIEVNGNMGYVKDISVRSTRIETFDRTDVIVPNADFVSGTVTNYTRGNTVGRVIVPVGVAYGTDTRKVEAILKEIAEAHPMVLGIPAPNVVFQGFGADSLDFEIRAILRDVNYVLSVKSDMNHEIARRFVEEGIEIPFAQRDIWLRNPEALRPSEGET
jgi:small-conductance mechanosensitive channel